MAIDTTEAVGLEGFEAIHELEAAPETDDRRFFSVLGVLRHDPNLDAAGGPAGFEKQWQYGVDMLVQKGSDSALAMFDAMHYAAEKAWGPQSQKEYDIAFQIADGLDGRSSNTTVADGDQIEPAWNGGCWIVKARSHDKPMLMDAAGRTMTSAAAVGRNWGVRCVVEAWAQKTKDRVNLRLLAVQAVQPNARQTGRTPEQTAAIVQGVLSKLPALPAGAFGQPQQQLELPVAATPVTEAPPRRQRPAPAKAVDPDAFFEAPKTAPASQPAQARRRRA